MSEKSSRGAELHASVPPEKWCVTREGLLDFRRQCLAAVREGRLRPTEADRFDVDDEIYRPTIYTVTIARCRGKLRLSRQRICCRQRSRTSDASTRRKGPAPFRRMISVTMFRSFSPPNY